MSETDNSDILGGSDHHNAIDATTDQPKTVLMVVANPTISPNNHWPVGFWAAELTHPHYGQPTTSLAWASSTHPSSWRCSLTPPSLPSSTIKTLARW